MKTILTDYTEVSFRPALAGGLLVEALTPDGRKLRVRWFQDGTGFPSVDELSDEESDAVFHAVFAEGGR